MTDSAYGLDIPEFKAFEKIPRLNRPVIATEKIDGTNGVIWIGDPVNHNFGEPNPTPIIAGSRNKWLKLINGEDNAGFGKWVKANQEELIAGLGPGYHYGEWWGHGIQRGYGLKEKRFSLFNTARWGDDAVRPKCCGVVPVLAEGTHISLVAAMATEILREKGSLAAPGFMKPEGVVLFHAASGGLFKVTLENDESPKGKENG